MILEKYTILNNTLLLKFDRKFKHIKVLKLELIDESIVETDNLEMRFSKEKDEIILFIKENMKFMMLYINMIDNEECNDAFYIKKEVKQEQKMDIKMDMSNIGMLIKSKAGDFFSNEVVDVDKKVCLIKSENIFAEINKKSDNGVIGGDISVS